MRRRLSAALLSITVFLIALPASAGDLVWERIMRNNHDVMAVGEIVELTDSVCVIEVRDTVVSARGNRKQLKPDTISLSIDKEDQLTPPYVGNRDALRQVGDYALVIADKGREGSLFDGYMYKVDGLDKRTLCLEIHGGASSGFLLEVKMIEDFIHSDGEHTEFGYRKSKDGKTRQAVRFRDQSRRDKDAEVIFEVGADAP